MRSVESEGETIDEAIENALRTLQVERAQVEVDILSDATRGVLGFGGKKARIRARVRAPLVTRLDEGDSSPGNDSRETSRGPMPAVDSTGSGATSSKAPGADVLSGTLGLRSKTVLLELLSHLGVSCTVSLRSGEEPGIIVLDVNGDSGGLLIGRRGQTLDALEYIVNRIATRREDGDGARVTIDVERYRERRREYLTALAFRLADKAKKTGHTVTLNPMNPRDRRVVHIALKDDPAVGTRSHGDGHFRKVAIVPAEGRRGPRQPRSREAD
jgi:spoIIIJ-associated protein